MLQAMDEFTNSIVEVAVNGELKKTVDLILSYDIVNTFLFVAC